jgi:hypothetical protein
MVSPNETEIVGNWITVDGQVRADEACHRIGMLTEHSFEKLGADPTGWETLYRDPTDGRLWECVYPKSEMHGGGPPTIRVLSIEQAIEKYPNVFGGDE